jgi:hypothetical protein
MYISQASAMPPTLTMIGSSLTQTGLWWAASMACSDA